MKKIIISVLVLGLIAVLALPYAHGALAKRVNNEIINSSNANGMYGSVEMTEYSSGYGSSQSTFKWVMNDDIGLFDAGEYAMKCQTKHKITGFLQSCNLEHPDYQSWVQDNLNGQDPVTVTMSGNLIGKFSSSLKVDPLTYTDDEGAKISIGAANIVSNLKGFNTKAIRFNGSADGMTIEDVKDNVVIKGISMSGDLESEGLFSFGVGDFLIEQVSFNTPESEFSFANARLNYEMPRSGEKLSVNYALGAEKMLIQDEGGKTITVTDPGYRFEAGGIDRDVAMEFAQQYQQTMATVSGNQQPDEEAMMALYAETSENLEKLLIPGLFFTLDSSGKVDGEPIQARFTMKLDQQITRDELVTAMFAPDQLLQKLDVAITASVTDAFLATLENQETVQAMINSPYVKQNGKQQEFNVTAKNGVINLNGEEVPIEALMGAAAGMVPQDSSQVDPLGQVQSPMDFDPAAMDMEDMSEEEKQELMQMIEQIQNAQ